MKSSKPKEHKKPLQPEADIELAAEWFDSDGNVAESVCRHLGIARGATWFEKHPFQERRAIFNHFLENRVECEQQLRRSRAEEETEMKVSNSGKL